MKKLFLVLIFIPLISCNDDWIPAEESQVSGCFKYGEDLIKFTSKTMQFNDGLVMDLTRSDGGSYFINAYFKGNELVAASVDYNPLTKQYRWTRFESGLTTSMLIKIDCP